MHVYQVAQLKQCIKIRFLKFGFSSTNSLLEISKKEGFYAMDITLKSLLWTLLALRCCIL